jgi:hypothetical protein
MKDEKVKQVMSGDGYLWEGKRVNTEDAGQ